MPLVIPYGRLRWRVECQVRARPWPDACADRILVCANQIYFKIAALAWIIKTWMLNLLHLGDGAVMRFKRFLYLWVNHACVVAKTGRETVVVRMDRGDYYDTQTHSSQFLHSNFTYHECK
jgi:hypothetical protein